MRNKTMRKITCPNCSVEFEAVKISRVYCCTPCKLEAAVIRAKANYIKKGRENSLANTNNNHPLPGDVVYSFGAGNDKIRNESLGVIIGAIGEETEYVTILFNPYLPVMIHKNESVNCASGFSISVKASELTRHFKPDINMLFEKTEVSTSDQLILVKRFTLII